MEADLGMVKIENVKFKALSKEEYAKRTQEYSSQLQSIQSKLAQATGNMSVNSPLTYIDSLTYRQDPVKAPSCVPELDSFVSPNLIMIGVLRSPQRIMVGVRLYDYALSCVSDYSVESVIARIREGSDRILNLDVILDTNGNPELICTMNTFEEYVQLDINGRPVSDYRPLTYIGGYDTGLFVDYEGHLIRIPVPMNALFLAVSSVAWEYGYNYSAIKATLIDLLTVGVSNLILGCITSNVNFTGILERAIDCHVFETGYTAYYFRTKAPIYQMDLESMLRFCASRGVGIKNAVTYKVMCPWCCLYRTEDKDTSRYDMMFRPVAFSFGYAADKFFYSDRSGRRVQSVSPATLNKFTSGLISYLHAENAYDSPRRLSNRTATPYNLESKKVINLHNSWRTKAVDARSNLEDGARYYENFPGFSFLYERNHYPVVGSRGITNFVRLDNAPDATTAHGVIWDTAGLDLNAEGDKVEALRDRLADLISDEDTQALRTYLDNAVWLEQVKFSSVTDTGGNNFAEPADIGLVTLYRSNPLLGTAEDNFSLGNPFLPQELVANMAETTLSSVARALNPSDFIQTFGCTEDYVSHDELKGHIHGASLSAVSPIVLHLEAKNKDITLHSVNMNNLPTILQLKVHNNKVKVLEVQGNSFLFEIMYIDDNTGEMEPYKLDKLILNCNSVFPEFHFGSSAAPKSLYYPESAMSVEFRELELRGNIEVVTPQLLSRLTRLNKDTCEKIHLCEGIIRIGYSAFSGAGISEIQLPSTLRYLDNSCFSDCLHLKSVDIPNGVLEIGAEAFSNCSMLETVRIPASVKAIHRNAFANCTKLRNLIIDGSPYIEDFAFVNTIPSILQRVEGYKHFSDGSRTSSPVRRNW